MRINARELTTSYQYSVFLDGKNVTDDCYEADDKAGYVKYYKRNNKGKFYIDKTNPERITCETKYGNVEIVDLKELIDR